MGNNYVLSDPHGMHSLFMEMLEKIDFSYGKDHLCINGDCIDRGPDGIKILQEIMHHQDSMTLILGNHEYMMLAAYKPNASEADKCLWMLNGGTSTQAAFQCLTKAEQNELLLFLRSCPSYVDVTVNGQAYHLTHGWPADSTYDRVWRHPPRGIESRNPLKDGIKLIVGHTVTLRLYTENHWEQNYIIRRMIEDNAHLRICKTPEFICIDCGCGHDLPVSRLACLRLDDMREFYV